MVVSLYAPGVVGGGGEGGVAGGGEGGVGASWQSQTESGQLQLVGSKVAPTQLGPSGAVVFGHERAPLAQAS